MHQTMDRGGIHNMEMDKDGTPMGKDGTPMDKDGTPMEMAMEVDGIRTAMDTAGIPIPMEMAMECLGKSNVWISSILFLAMSL